MERHYPTGFYPLPSLLPLYQVLKKPDHFAWASEAQEALGSLKKLLEKPPILTAPAPGEPMLLYITATTQVVSATLVVECDEPHKVLKVQRPVYFDSEVLSDSKTRTHRSRSSSTPC
jgi:hypothetical protein